jgi:hypothetical protein
MDKQSKRALTPYRGRARSRLFVWNYGYVVQLVLEKHLGCCGSKTVASQVPVTHAFRLAAFNSAPSLSLSETRVHLNNDAFLRNRNQISRTEPSLESKHPLGYYPLPALNIQIAQIPPHQFEDNLSMLADLEVQFLEPSQNLVRRSRRSMVLRERNVKLRYHRASPVASIRHDNLDRSNDIP